MPRMKKMAGKANRSQALKAKPTAWPGRDLVAVEVPKPAQREPLLGEGEEHASRAHGRGVHQQQQTGAEEADEDLPGCRSGDGVEDGAEIDDAGGVLGQGLLADGADDGDGQEQAEGEVEAADGEDRLAGVVLGVLVLRGEGGGTAGPVS